MDSLGLFFFVQVAPRKGMLTNGNQVTITETNPIPPQEFYRIGISLP
jgi:hypothetical protein